MSTSGVAPSFATRPDLVPAATPNPGPGLAAALDAIDDVLIVLDGAEAVLHANAAARRELGLQLGAKLPVHTSLGERGRAHLLTHGRWEGRLGLGRGGVGGRHWAVELQLVPGDGADTDHTVVRATPVPDDTDPLTGLPNRNSFMEQLDRLLPEAATRRTSVALLLIDIDGFRFVANSIGGLAGDRILEAVALRLKKAFPASTLLARIGGDEFAVACAGEVAPDALAAKVREACAAPLYIDGDEVQLSATIGIAVSALGATVTDGASLLRSADAAASSAKRRGPGTVEVFDRRLQAEARQRLDGEQALRRALRNNELRLHYQPQVDLRTGRIVGLEALVRWQPAGGPLRSPALFMDLAETTGLIVPMGRWVLQEACTQLAAWSSHDLRMAVNLSMRQLADDDLVAMVREVLDTTGVAPERLELEITESMLMADLDQTTERLAACRDLGVTVAIDDFGTGYSSLQYLRVLPVDGLKIDRSFVGELDEGGRDRPIVGAIVELARALGLTTVGEGVEEASQLHALRELGCDVAQGYHVARPLAATDLEDLLTTDPRW